MKEFNEWFSSHPRNSGNDNRFRNKEGMRMAYKAGMLAAADIAELAKEFILPADDLADLIAQQIREYADDD